MKLAITELASKLLNFEISKQIIKCQEADYTEICAVIATTEDEYEIKKVHSLKFNIPIILITKEGEHCPENLIHLVHKVIDTNKSNYDIYKRQVETLAKKYESEVDAPFFKLVKRYVKKGKNQFNCPGHHGGAFFERHPAGKSFVNFLGKNIFRSDLCIADAELGDLLIHDGPPCTSEQFAAKVFNADKTYFVLNGSSGSVKTVLSALLAPGDLVLYDRNNHKSVCIGGLVDAGATPIYLETARNPFGSIGGILEHCLNEDYIRNLIKEVLPEKADLKRPFRAAVIQLGTYDGTIANAKHIVEKIGKLCDYIVFDSAWVGYEQFIPMMNDCSPMLLKLNDEDPGLLVIQSVHKQMAGFSQASQIHKKDSHIKNQERYINHKRLNNAFMKHASTSPFYAIFNSLDVNAKIHDGEAGKRLWHDCVIVGIETRKLVLKNCHYIKPLVPTIVHDKKWEDGDSEKMSNDIAYWSVEPDTDWHGFEGYGKGQYFVDPCKFQLTTPGFDVKTGNYTDFGISANILINYLREYGIVADKCDLNTILFLMTPAETMAKMQDVVNKLIQFENIIDSDLPMQKVLPVIYNNYIQKYEGWSIKKLCIEMHNFYKERNVSILQKRLFLKEYLPEVAMNPQEANFEFVRGHGELISLNEVKGRIALEGALPYPPGVICVIPGERWTETAQKYFLALQDAINEFPGFSPEIQGVYLEKGIEGKIEAKCYVLKKEYETKK